MQYNIELTELSLSELEQLANESYDAKKKLKIEPAAEQVSKLMNYLYARRMKVEALENQYAKS